MKTKEEEQLTLAMKVSLEDGFRKINRVAGADSAYVGRKIVSGAVVMEYGTEVETAHVIREVIFPYKASFLMFTEGPSTVEAIQKTHGADLLFIDGHGIAHPRGAGLACYVGIVTKIPTIGIAKKPLVGNYIQPRKEWEATKLIFRDRQVGWVLKTGEFYSPIFISPGHMVSLKSSLELTKKYLKNRKLPEPLYRAHEYVNKVKADVETE